MGLEAAGYNTDEEEPSPLLKEELDVDEQQRKGLFRTLFGYFRGSKKNPQNELDSRSVKDIAAQGQIEEEQKDHHWPEVD